MMTAIGAVEGDWDRPQSGALLAGRPRASDSTEGAGSGRKPSRESPHPLIHQSHLGGSEVLAWYKRNLFLPRKLILK